MARTIIKTTELPRDIQEVLRSYEFKKQTVYVEPVVDFVCPTNWHDYNCMTLIGYNQLTGQHKAMRSGNYESHMCWTREERAMYAGEIKTTIPDTSTWFFVIDTYPDRCIVYCHPLALAKALPAPDVELPRREAICLFITKTIMAAGRLEEARRFKFTKKEWDHCKFQLLTKGFMRANGSLTIEGKNRAQSLNFNTWEEV